MTDSTGPPDDTGRDHDFEFERRIALAVRAPELSDEFRARLRRRLMELHPRAKAKPSLHTRMESETMTRNTTNPGSRRHRKTGSTLTPAGGRRRRTRRRPFILSPVFLLTAAAVVVAVLLVPRLMPGFGPVAEFGKLPGVAVAAPPNQGGAGGPGYTFDFDYRLGTPLTAGWPSLPGREPAYRLRPHEHTETAAGRIAANLGITAPVVREGWHDGYVLAADPGDGGPSLRMFPSGYTHFTQFYNYTPLARGDLPGDARAIAIARGWLEAAGLVPAGELDAGRVSVADLENGYVTVWFAPERPADVVSLAPWAMVQVGASERIVSGSANWFASDTSSPYPLRNVAEAWREVEQGKGVLEWNIREYTGPAGDDSVISGTATITQVRVAWSLTFADDLTPYLVPVYSFSGSVLVPGQDGQVSLPLQVWATAVAGQYVQGP